MTIGTPIRERFKVDTIIQDRTAAVPVLDVAALVTTNDLFTGARFQQINESDWSTVLTPATEEYYFFQAYFGQDLKPDVGLIIYWNKAGGLETVGEAITDAYNTGAQWYQTNYVGKAAADIADQLALAQAVQSFPAKIQCLILTNDPNAKDDQVSTDIGAQMKALNLDRCGAIYHPTGTVGGVDVTNQRPDAAVEGRMLPTDEGAEQWDYHVLKLVSDSGMTPTERTDLRGKGYNFVETIRNTTFTHLYPGRNCTDREIRVQWGADWFDQNVQASLATWAFQTPLMSFDQPTFATVEGIVRDWMGRCVERRIILDDFKVTLPDPDTIPANIRASGIAEFNNVWTATLNSAIDGWTLTGTWSVGGV